MKRKFRRQGTRLVQVPSAKEFANALEENEESMGEHAAMAVTCEEFGLSEEEGYDLLIALAGDRP